MVIVIIGMVAMSVMDIMCGAGIAAIITSIIASTITPDARRPPALTSGLDRSLSYHGSGENPHGRYTAPRD